jgi:transporter family-2 protein
MTTYGYALLALLAGLGIPVMAAMNANVGIQLGSPILSTVILFSVGLIATCLVLLLFGLPIVLPKHLPAPTLFFSGLWVAFYILTITWISPRFGVANAILFVLLGQMVAALIVDHFGLFDALPIPINVTKVIGLTFMIVGIFLIKKIK